MRIVLDTGASHSCIDKQFVSQIFPNLMLEPNEGVNAGIGGMGFEVMVADLPDFRIGRYHQKILENVAVIDFTHINAAYRMLHRKPLQMILGNDFCIKHNAIIDYGQNKLIFQR